MFKGAYTIARKPGLYCSEKSNQLMVGQLVLMMINRVAKRED